MLIKTSHGITIIDLLITLSVIAILTGIALPAMDHFIHYSRITSETMALRGALHLARKTAITERKKVTVCPSKTAEDCTKHWSDGYMVFIDEDGGRNFNGSDKLLLFHQIDDEQIRLNWRAFGQKGSLQWRETGITNHQNGSFEFCFQSKPQFHRALIITKAGRVRLSKDSNGDDIHENARGKNIEC